MDWFFWVVIGVIGVALIAAGIIVAVSNRRHRELEAGRQAELEATAPGEDVVVAPSEPGTEPLAPEPEAVPTEPAVSEPEPVAVEKQLVPAQTLQEFRVRMKEEGHASSLPGLRDRRGGLPG